MRTLVILGHPNPDSYCAALARTYADSARQAGAHVDLLDLSTLHFDPHLHGGYHAGQPLEPDLQRAQQLISQADHLCLVTPTWWSSMPALLKGFIDRVFLPGFAFRYRPGRMLPEQLLRGRSARVIVSTDTPPLLLRTLLGDPTLRSLSQGVLAFCGYRVRSTRLGPIRGSSETQRAAWLERTAHLARQDHARRAARPAFA